MSTNLGRNSALERLAQYPRRERGAGTWAGYGRVQHTGARSTPFHWPSEAVYATGHPEVAGTATTPCLFRCSPSFHLNTHPSLPHPLVI